jgi:flagellar biosynthesis anti-sigma factor FlgM
MVQGIQHSAVNLHRVEAQAPELRPRSISHPERDSAAHLSSEAVDFSPHLRDIQRAIETVRQAPDVRVDRVHALREAIAAGRYSLDPAELAVRLAAKLRPDAT